MPTRPALLVSVTGLAPGAPLSAAVALCDALDARRVPATLAVGPRPHPEVAAFVTARRRAGDAVLLHGTRPDDAAGRPYRRLPALEARLRLAGALRGAEALGLAVDGFAAPGWAASPGTRRALAEAGLDLLLDDLGLHRLDRAGVPTTTVAGPVVAPGPPRAPAGGGGQLLSERLRRRRPGPGSALCHLAAHLPTPATTDPTAGARAVLAAVDAALEGGALPAAATTVIARPRTAPRTADGSTDPEHWATTA